MKVEAKIEEQPAREAGGFAQRLWDFLKLLEEMENKKEKVRTVSGELEGPFDSKAVYGYTVKLGIENRDFPFRRGFHPRPRPPAHVRSIRAENVAAEPVIDVFDEGGCISVVAQMPHVKEEDIGLRIIDNILTITARTPEGEIERDISVSDGSEIKETSFKNGILEIKIKKEK